MHLNYRVNIIKWLPLPKADLQTWFTDSIKLVDTMSKVSKRIACFNQYVVATNSYDKEAFSEIINNLEGILRDYRKLLEEPTTFSTHLIYRHKALHLSTALKRNLNTIAEFTRILINNIIDYRSNDVLYITCRLINVYNDILDSNRDVSNATVNIFYNDCPSMLEPLRKFSVTRVLQILAKNRAEELSHEFINCFLSNYVPSIPANSWTGETADHDSAENSSIEIYRSGQLEQLLNTVLTRHLTPPGESNASSAQRTSTNLQDLQALIRAEHGQLLRILNAIQDASPGLFGSDALRTSNGCRRLRGSATKKALDYYDEISWAAVSNVLDHVILWWSPEVLGIRNARDGVLRFKQWLRTFFRVEGVPVNVRSTLRNLCDALGCHGTITVWDHLFRSAYISSFDCRSTQSSVKGTDTGRMYTEVMKFLVETSNECELVDGWLSGVPLTELPLSEQIIVLHRLDHSVHTCRIWTTLEAKSIAHTWRLNVFFLLVKTDVVDLLDQLSRLKLADHSDAPFTDEVSVQVQVCARMRTKICSEVASNVQLLKESPAACIDVLAKICRVTCLANLHMCFPRRNYWRASSDVPPASPSPYVGTYFEKVLLPVVEVLDEAETSNMILKIMCECWLDYIYLHRIKFSEYGALQLLTDFAFVSTWVNDCSIISGNVKDHLLKNEVLRRCEGVGRLLLRQRGESIAMRKRAERGADEENDSPVSLGLERMPAEMYVPNQEQWLELRASKCYSFCCTE